MSKTKARQTVAKKTKTISKLPEWPFDARRTLWVFLGLSFVLTMILFFQYLFGPNLFIFNDSGSDTITVFFPNLVHAARYFQEVGFPGWSFYSGLGFNMYPWYLLNPFHWIILFMGPEMIAYSIGWLHAILLFLTGWMFYLFLREAKFELPVSFFGALVYTFGGYMVLGQTWYVHGHAIFWMTLSFLGFELLLRRKIWWLFPIPFVFILGTRGYFLILFMTLYGLIRMLDVYGPALKSILHGYKRMLLCGLVAGLFVLPFVGGKWHKFANSPRVTGNVSHTERLMDYPVFGTATAKHNVTAAMRIFSNNTVGDAIEYKGWRNYLEAPCLYIGLITLLLVFQFFALADNRRRWIYGSFLMVWMLMMLFPWFRFGFYGFAGDYYKGALSLFIPFSFLFVGLLGWQQMLERKTINKWVLFLSLFIWLIVLWYPYNQPDVTISQTIQLQASVFLVGHAFLLWFWAEGMLRKLIYPLMILWVSAEAIIISSPTLNDRLPIKKADIAGKKYHFDDTMEAVKRVKALDKDPFYRMDKVYGSIKTGYNDGMVQGFFGSKMYQSHNHKYYVEFLDKTGVIDATKEANTRWLVGLSATNLLHGLFSIKYLMSNEASAAKVDGAIYSPIDTVGGVTVSRNNYYIPFGIPIESYLTREQYDNLSVNERRRSLYFSVVAEPDADWKNKLNPFPVEGFSFYGTAVKDRTQELAGKAMKLEHFSQNRITGNIEVADPVVLFLSLPYDQGWKAKVDGAERKLDLVDIGFTGLFLEPGKHTIELYYEPPLSKWGWFGLIGAALGVLLMIRFNKKL